MDSGAELRGDALQTNYFTGIHAWIVIDLGIQFYFGCLNYK